MSYTYNPMLTLFSVLVAIFASYVALNLAYSVTQAKGKTQLAWLLAGSLAMGIGIWSMHFIGMLAFEMSDMEMAYDIPLMLLSVVVAVFGSALALYVVSRTIVTKFSIIFGGITMAIAISGMHYIGMFSMRMQARIEWDLALVGLSILIALAASFAALRILTYLRSRPDRVVLMLLASTLMGFAIAGMHYTGMFAATFIHDPSIAIKDDSLIVSSGLSITTISTTISILMIALLSSVGVRILQSRQRSSEDIIGQTEEKYRVIVEAVKDYAIFALDPAGIIKTWNTGAERITGYSSIEIIGKHMSTLYPRHDIDSAMAETELRTAEMEGHYEGEAIRRRKDGSTFWANIVLDPIFDKSGKVTGFSKVVRDVTSLKEMEVRSKSLNEELERRVEERTLAAHEREKQLRTITNAVPVLLAQLDREEKFLFANNSFCDWFLCSPIQVTNMSFRQVLGEDRYPENKSYIDRALKGETVSYERNSQSGSKEAILNITFVPEYDGENQVKGFIVVAADVSNYKKIEAELKSAKEEAEVANETKSAFLANMSHEIRTPLGSVIGFSELLTVEDMPIAEKQNAIEIIKRNGKLLSTIINEILDLSKIEAGKLEFEHIDVKLSDLMNEISVFLNLEASGKGVQLAVSSEGLLPTYIKTDPTRLRQILLNIVGNAIKFTERGQISLVAKLDSIEKNKIAFIVQDTGTGITPEQAKRLFSPFTQADVTTTRKFGGTGLGLVLSKKFANALGGDVVLADSTFGKGSTFIITVTHGQSEAELKLQTEQQKVESKEFDSAKKVFNLSYLKVLVTDDSPDNLALIQRILKMAEVSVDVAGNGRDAVNKALAGNYDVILMDLQMPEMDGYEATKELRRRGFNRPIIALTAHAMKEERKRCLESGFNDHITKPIDRNLLLQTLAGYSRDYQNSVSK